MDQATHNKIASFIWGVADDVLRDLKSRGSQQQLLADFEELVRRFQELNALLYGQENNPETYAVCKADMLDGLLKGSVR